MPAECVFNKMFIYFLAETATTDSFICWRVHQYFPMDKKWDSLEMADSEVCLSPHYGIYCK